jgi:hypothetical protein
MNLTMNFTEQEAFGKCDKSQLAIPYEEALYNAIALAIVLEQWRGIEGPIGINSWVRDIAQNLRLAKDPASAARAAKRPGPHCYGGSADCSLLKNEAMSGAARDSGYVASFTRLYKMAHQPGGFPINEAILEYSGDNTRITHIHVQVRRDSDPARKFITRKWKLNVATGKQEELYQDWTP